MKNDASVARTMLAKTFAQFGDMNDEDLLSALGRALINASVLDRNTQKMVAIIILTALVEYLGFDTCLTAMEAHRTKEVRGRG